MPPGLSDHDRERDVPVTALPLVEGLVGGTVPALDADPLTERAQAARRLQPAGGAPSASDRLAALAARLLGAPAAQISLLSDVQVIAGSAGLPPGATGSRGAVADSLCTVTAASGGPLVVTDAAHDDRVAHLPPVTSGAVGAYLGVPLVSEDGHVVGALCVFGPQPRSWSQTDVTTLEQLASAAVAELELSALSGEYEANRVVLELAVSAAQIGTFDLDVVTGDLAWDDRLIEMFGFTRATFDRSMPAFLDRLHPDDSPKVTEALQAAIDTCGRYEAEYRILLPDGQTRWVTARGRALCDERGVTVRVLGAAHDSTALRAQETRTAQILESMSVGFLAVDRDWRYTYVNAEAERLLGLPRAELLGGTVWDLFPAAVGTPFETNYRRAMDAGEQVTFDAYYPAPLDAWLEVRVWPSADGLSVYFLDVTARRTAQRAAERAAARSALFADVAAALAASLDAATAIAQLPRLLVPAVADWCALALADDGGGRWRDRLHDVTTWVADPARRQDVARVSAAWLAALDDDSTVSRALDSGASMVFSGGEVGRTVAELPEGGARALAEQVGPAAVAVFPLLGRGHTVGVLTVSNGGTRGAFSEEDLTTLREVGDQVGLALDNARLYAQQRILAEELQRSLLAPLPQPGRLQVVARYVPAAAGAAIGGDWYDAFVVRDGSTALVIGDVAGHDRAAAVVMAQVRNILRGIGYAVAEPPATVLGLLDASLRDLVVGTLTTAVLATVEDPAGPAGGHPTLRWSNAGHPPPLLLHTDGSAELLTRSPDLLLGLAPETERHDHTQALPPGSTLVLYTDGLVERRGEVLDVGLERLRRAGARAAGLDLDALCDAVLAELAEGADDDVALLAVRVHDHGGGG